MGPGLRALVLLGSCAAAAGTAGLSIQDACRNEAGLFCPGRKGRALVECLKGHPDGASKACRARLAGTPPPAAAPAAETADKERYPELGVDVDIAGYAVDGADPDELRAQLDRLGPFDPALKRHVPGKTKDDIRWSFKSKLTPAGCAIDSVAVDVSVVQDLPRWEAPSDAAKPLAASWGRFMTALKTHEDGHKDIALKTAQGILLAVRNQPPQADCAGLTKAAGDAAGAWFEKEKQENLEYDRRTKHGITQGAVFP